MSHGDIFLGDDSESIHVIGYFPTKFDPSIPDALLIEDGGVAKTLHLDRSKKSCVEKDHTQATMTDLRMKAGEWLVVDERPKVVPMADLQKWRDRTAVDLVQRAMETKGSPLKVLNMLESAARLRSLDLVDFVSKLSTQRASASEPLEEVFLRVRGNRTGGQTG
jgi:hypothetical protein